MDESECIAGLVVARILGEQEEQPSDLRAILLNRQIKSLRNRDIAGKSKGRCGTVWKAHRDPRKGHEGNDGRGGVQTHEKAQEGSPTAWAREA